MGSHTQVIYTRALQITAFIMVNLILIGVLLGMGYLYKIQRVTGSDIALGIILGNVFGVWAAITTKIFRTQLYQGPAKGE